MTEVVARRGRARRGLRDGQAHRRIGGGGGPGRPSGWGKPAQATFDNVIWEETKPGIKTMVRQAVMKLWRRHHIRDSTGALCLQANLASPLPDCIVLVCCTLVHVAWLAMRSPPPAIAF